MIPSVVINHVRATPRLWLIVPKDELKHMRNGLKDAYLTRSRELLPRGGDGDCDEHRVSYVPGTGIIVYLLNGGLLE